MALRPAQAHVVLQGFTPFARAMRTWSSASTVMSLLRIVRIQPPMEVIRTVRAASTAEVERDDVLPVLDLLNGQALPEAAAQQHREGVYRLWAEVGVLGHGGLGPGCRA